MNDRSYDQRFYRRPILLTLVAVLEIIAGVSVMLVGAVTVIMGMPEGLMEELDFSFDMGATVIGVIFIILGLIVASIGGALFSGKMWGWWFAVVMTVLSLISGLVSGMIFGAVFQLLILIYLMTDNTRGWFKYRSRQQIG
ncbi:MAG: DUF7144 family membrane protein [Candidatus Methanomethylophilaceae archaeon]|jgi:hypothetical protein